MNLQADLYNVTNHTQFTVASPVFGNSQLWPGLRHPSQYASSAQLAGRIEF